MKTIVLVALLTAVACSKKTSDCEVSIARSMDSISSMIKARASNPQMQEMMMSVVGKRKAALISRCNQDQWAPDALACFAAVKSPQDMQACDGKLTQEQRTKLHAELRQAGKDARMPGGIAGHPSMLSGSDGSAIAPAGSAAAPAPSGSAAPAPSGSAAPAPAAGSQAK